MKNTYLFTFLLCLSVQSQTSISGRVLDNNSLPIAGANIIVSATSQGTITDLDGIFTLTVSQTPPFSLQISSVGFEPQTFQITTNNQVVNAILVEGTSLDEIIVSASRTPERIFESPVTVERFGIKEIKNTSAASFMEVWKILRE